MIPCQTKSPFNSLNIASTLFTTVSWQQTVLKHTGLHQIFSGYIGYTFGKGQFPDFDCNHEAKINSKSPITFVP